MCLDAKTGERVWHYQLIHHDIWDWDNPTAPILMDLVVDGTARSKPSRRSRSRRSFTRSIASTGEPVWPIEERPVPQTDVPGEWTSPTQPFPTKPPAFDRQGVTVDDLIDFTPALRAEAVEGVKSVPHGADLHAAVAANAPDGTQRHADAADFDGGANWEGGAFDPETNVLYVGSYTNPSVSALEPPPASAPTSATSRAAARSCRGCRLPLIKPPWGRITAIDMNKGEHLWQIAERPDAEGRSPSTRRSQGSTFRRRAARRGPSLLVTKTLLFAAEGWGGAPILRAHDKATGEVVAEIALPGAVGGRPMTYMIDGKQYVILSVAGANGAEIVALTL